MTRSIVKLPRDVGEEFEVYLNGVLQQPDVDFYIDRRALLFERPLRKDRVSWRWLLGAWGVGTYRQDDTVDVRYEHDGEMRVAHARSHGTGGLTPTVDAIRTREQPRPSGNCTRARSSLRAGGGQLGVAMSETSLAERLRSEGLAEVHGQLLVAHPLPQNGTERGLPW